MYPKTHLTKTYMSNYQRTFRYNLPAITSISPVTQSALDATTLQVLNILQYSLNEDGILMLSELLATGEYSSYLNIVVETAISETIATLENTIYDSYADDKLDITDTTVDSIASYIIDNMSRHKRDIYNFSYLVLTSPISDIVSMAQSLQIDNITIDTFSVKGSNHTKTV